jgi:hypothetical protein
MAPSKRRTGGRTTPKGTKPGQLSYKQHGNPTAEASSRYTPPIAHNVRVSPQWVPILMFALLGVGAVVILFYYLGFVPGGRSNWYLFGGLSMVLGGLFTATKYH